MDLFYRVFFIMMFALILFCFFMGMRDVFTEEPPVPPVVERHEPSDLDSGDLVPGSQRWDRVWPPGADSPQGAPGPPGPSGITK